MSVHPLVPEELFEVIYCLEMLLYEQYYIQFFFSLLLLIFVFDLWHLLVS